MNSRQLSLLGAAALVIIALAIWLGLARKPGGEESALLFPALKGQLANVSAVRIYQGGDQPVVEATRDSGDAKRWHLKQRNDYAADAAKLNGLLIALEGAKLREEKTSNPDNYATLGVQDDAARVELVGVEPAIKLIVGKNDTTTRGTYVRRAGEPQSWSISEQLDLPKDPAAWLKRDLLNIGADRVQEVAVQMAGQPKYSALKNKRADANFDVKPLPKGRELNSVSAANSFAQNLVGLQLDDVRPAAELANVKPAGQVTVRNFDGLLLDLSGFAHEGKQWITVSAKFDAALAERFHLPTAPAGEKPADKPTAADTSLADANKKINDEAQALNQQLSNWAFAIPQYKYDAIFKPVETLLRPK